MNELNIKISGCGKYFPAAVVDGKSLYLKKDSSGNYVGSYLTDSDSAQVSIYRLHEACGKFWFLAYFIFYIVSVFGFFDSWRGDKCIFFNYTHRLNLTGDNTLHLQLNRPQKTGMAFTVRAACAGELIENAFYVDKKVKTRTRIFRLIKLLTWIALFVIIPLAVIM